jgi:PAS domain S-box-containing protein
MIFSLVALTIAAGFYLTRDYTRGKAEFLYRLTILTQVTADNCRASLAFNDRGLSESTLETLASEPAILQAVLLGSDGDVVASYPSDLENPDIPADLGGDASLFQKGVLHLSKPVKLGGRVLGKLYIQTSAKELQDLLVQDLLVLLLVSLVATVIAVLLARRLQLPISGSILELVDMAERLRMDEDFVPEPSSGETRSDEIGKLARAFIDMFAEVRSRQIALQDSESRHRTLVEAAPFGIQEIDLQGRLISMNSAGLGMLGMPVESELEKKDYLSILEPEDREAVSQLFADALNGKESEFDFSKWEDGKQTYIVSRFVPLRDDQGHVDKIMWLTQDMTQREALQTQLREAQKMEAVGQLTGGIAHDFNNILTAVLGNLDLLEMDAALSEESQERITAINLAFQRAADLTRQLLGFSRRNVIHVENTDINRVISGMENLIARSITPEISVELHFIEDLWLTEVDPGDFQDTLLNLSLNARDAMAGHGTLTIETGNTVLDADYCDQNSGANPGDYVEVAISDTGTGIDQETLDHIFEPFFTTKVTGKGSGLGLAMVFGFVQRTGGSIKVYTQKGVGTTFRIFLPRILGDDTAPNAGGDNLEEMPRGTETVLVVDDEAQLRKLINYQLIKLGYKVVTAGNGKEALERLAEEHSISLLLSDVIMPGGMNGYELAEIVMEHSPEIKVLLSSGFTEKATKDGEPEFSNHNMLRKPYTYFELAQRVRDAIDDTQRSVAG